MYPMAIFKEANMKKTALDVRVHWVLDIFKFPYKPNKPSVG
jgi:hypothetical protein